LKHKRPRIYYGWIIVAVSFITLFMALGIRYSFSVFFIAILEEYGWGRGETAGAFSLAMVVHGVFAPVTGTLVDWLGPRKLFPLGAVFLIVGLVAASSIRTLGHLYLYFGVVVAVGVNTLSYAPHMSLIPKWFITKRGLASGLVLAGIGTGAMVLLPATEYIIDTLGWRSAFIVLALLVLSVVVPLTLVFQRRSPEEVGQFPDGREGESAFLANPGKEAAASSKRASRAMEPWTVSAAIASASFWYVSFTVFCNGFVINLLLVHQAVHMVDTGYSPMLAASLVGLVGLIGSLGGIGWGFISDRMGRERANTLGGLAAFSGVLAFLLLDYVPSPWLLYGYVGLYGLGFGSFGPMTATATGDLFPGNALGRILSLQSVGFGIGGALGAYAGGYFYDITGSYMIPFITLLVIILLGIGGIWLAAPRRSVLF
jgi:MFS family permease